MNFEIKLRPVKSGASKLKAMMTIVFNEVIEIDGFKLVEGSQGLFLSVPAHQGKGKDADGNEIDKWYDDIRFPQTEEGDAFKRELTQEAINQWNALNKTPSPTRGETASANTASRKPSEEPKQETQPARARKPLW